MLLRLLGRGLVDLGRLELVDCGSELLEIEGFRDWCKNDGPDFGRFDSERDEVTTEGGDNDFSSPVGCELVGLSGGLPASELTPEWRNLVNAPSTSTIFLLFLLMTLGLDDGRGLPCDWLWLILTG